MTREPSAAQTLPPGWDETHLAAYREGYTDALVWALEHEDEEIMEVLDGD